MPQGYTTVKYGDVVFYRCQTRMVDQSPEWDPSHTDVMFMRTKISISGYLNGLWYGYVSGASPSDVGPTGSYPLTFDGLNQPGNIPVYPQGYASTREQQIRRKLGPRQTFTMLVGDDNGDGFGGTPLFECNPAPVNEVDNLAPGMSPPAVGVSARTAPNGQKSINLSGIDVCNGPKCTSFRITSVHGDNLYSIEAEFEICHLECDIDGNVPGNTFGVLSNKWSCHDALDSNLRTTRTYAGTLRCASQINAQQLRWLCLPPLVRMFRREHFEFTVSEDGLTLKWVCVDQEVACTPPYPALTWNVTSSTQALNAMQARQTVEVSLTGNVNTNKSDLTELALYIMSIKIFAQTPQQINQANLGKNDPAVNNNNQYLVDSLEFVDYIGDEIRITGRMSARAPLRGNNFDSWVQQGANFANNDFREPATAALLTNSAIKNNARPSYNGTYSYGAYPIGSAVPSGVATFKGDVTEYSSPAASITQIFMNYLQYPCSDTHATYNGPGTPGPGGSAPYYQRNLDSTDNNQQPYVDVTSPTNSNQSPDPDPAPSNPPTYNTTVVPSDAPELNQNPYVSPGQQARAYTHWQLQNLYTVKTMRIQLPIANVAFPDSPITGPQAGMFNVLNTSSFAQLGGEQATRIVRVMAQRIGSEASFPDINTWFNSFIVSGISASTPSGDPPAIYYTSANSNIAAAGASGSQIFQWPLKRKIKPSTVTTTITGQLLYTAVAEYHIGLSRAPNAGEQLDLGNNMWDNLGKQTTDASGQLTLAVWDALPTRSGAANFISS